MKKTISSVILIVWVFLSFSQNNSIPLGKLNPFWRNHPVLGPFLQDGIWLNEVPDYFFDTDFPYKKRPFEKEVLFADNLSVVRLLGGIDNYPGLQLVQNAGVNPDGTMKKLKLNASDTATIRKLSKYDFVFRKSDGSLGFRPELISQRLRPYLDNGYNSFTIVLDNVPWCLAKNPIIGSFGQVAPPDDANEWYATVKELCETLKNILGEKKANGLRFRIGTEMNGKERFAGTEREFITHFDYAAAAIADILPGARLSLYNISSATVENIKKKHNVNAFRVLEHASSGVNMKSGKPNISLPFVAASRYYCEKNDLHAIVKGIDEVWDFIKDSIPGYKNFTREIHEFGAIGDWNADPKTDNPDAFGNAMNLQVIINLRASGLDRLFLWNMLEPVPASPGDEIFMLPNSQLWGYSILEYMAGGEAFQIIPEQQDVTGNTTNTALISVFNKKSYLLVNSFNPNRSSHPKNKVILKIPKQYIPFQIDKLGAATQNNSNSIMYHIRQDLEKEKLLSPKLFDKPEYISSLKNMASDYNKSCRIVYQNSEKYKSMWKESLTLRKFEGTVEDDGKFYKISLEMNAPESVVILFSE